MDERAVDAIVTQALQAWRVPGAAVAIVRRDGVLYSKGLGVKQLGRAEPVTAETLFAIGSCTKAFTTTAVAMLADMGKLAWDDPVRKHVGFFHLADPLADANVTLRDLATHRTGLRSHDWLWYHSPWTQEDIIRKLAQLKADHPFRSEFQYQTAMYLVLGRAVETASGTRWADFVQKRLLDPLQMTETTFTTAAALTKDHAIPHRWNGQGQVDTIPWYDFKEPMAAGSINASARDLGKWLRFQLGAGSFEGKRLVSARSLEETHTPQFALRMDSTPAALHPDSHQISYGMAWVIQDYRGHKLVSHAGAIDGFRAHLTLLPEDNFAIAILCNLDQTRMNLALSNSLVDHLLGLPAKNWNRFIAEKTVKEVEALRTRRREREEKRQQGTKPSLELAAYVGTYEQPAYGTVRVTLERGNLEWQWNAFSVPLEHFHYDTFSAHHEVLGDFQVVFRLGTDGSVASMNVVDLLDLEFRKVAKPRSR
jgi:CubicO group peptidase (beta-lactamase class C family)